MQRLLSGMWLLLLVSTTAFDNKDSVRKVVVQAREDLSYVAIKFSPKKRDLMPMLFLDLMRNDTVRVTFENSRVSPIA